MSDARTKAIALLGSGLAKRDRLLLSLIRERSLTGRQQRLIETLWTEWQQQKEATMHKKISCAAVAAVTILGLAGCMATYEKRFHDQDGRLIVMEETRELNPLINWASPEWLEIRRERISRDGQTVVDRTCRENYETQALLDCTGK